MSDDPRLHHQIDCTEFRVIDMAQVQRFFAATVGWECTDYGPEYAGIRKPGSEAGGLRVKPEVADGHRRLRRTDGS